MTEPAAGHCGAGEAAWVQLLQDKVQGCIWKLQQLDRCVCATCADLRAKSQAYEHSSVFQACICPLGRVNTWGDAATLGYACSWHPCNSSPTAAEQLAVGRHARNRVTGSHAADRLIDFLWCSLLDLAPSQGVQLTAAVCADACDLCCHV
jgi:hypothetical protein